MPPDPRVPLSPRRGYWQPEAISINRPDALVEGMRYSTMDGLVVVSSCDNVRNEGLQWHLSVSAGWGQRRANRLEVKRALSDFDAEGFEEDNHHNGKARHFWRDSWREHQICPCKKEPVLVDSQTGHRWQPEEGDPDVRERKTTWR